MYVPEFWLDVTFGDVPPPGYVFVDRYSGIRFTTIEECRARRGGFQRPVLLDLVYIEDPYGYEPGWIAGGRDHCRGWDDDN